MICRGTKGKSVANEQSPENRRRYEFAEQEAKAKRAGLMVGKESTAAVGVQSCSARTIDELGDNFPIAEM